MTVTQQDLWNGIDLCEYSYQGSKITWWGYKAGVVDLETAEGDFSLELPFVVV